MKSRRTLAIWGDGAVGCGLAVTFSASRDVLLVGPPGSGRGRVEVSSVGAVSGTVKVDKVEAGDILSADDCIVAVKAYDLAVAAGPAAASASGACICLSNGMGLERFWTGPAAGIEPAVLTAGFRTLGRFSVEASSGQVIAGAGGLARTVFRNSGLPVRTVEDLEPVRWGKWVVNSVINPLGAITRLPNDRLLRSGLGDCVEMLFAELVSAVPGRYREEGGKEALSMLRVLLGSSGNRCSMLQDLEAGRETEIDYLTGLAADISKGSCPVSEFVSGLVRAIAPGS